MENQQILINIDENSIYHEKNTNQFVIPQEYLFPKPGAEIDLG